LRPFLHAGFIFLGLCLFVLALSWKYVFNCVTGPYPFVETLAAHPGVRELVSAEGEFVHTGM
jgi:hypothetical protein